VSLSSLLDRLGKVCVGHTRSELRGFVQDGLDELTDCDAPYMRWIGTDNEGFPPYLITVAGTYRYQVIGANLSCGLAGLVKSIGGVDYAIRARRVISLFMDVSADDFDFRGRWLGAPYQWVAVNPWTSQTDRLSVANLAVDQTPATEDEPATLTFKEDPGATTDKYFCLFAWEAPRLTSNSIPLPISKSFERALYDYVRGITSEDANADESIWTKRFYNYWKPRFEKEEAVRGAQADHTEVTPRWF